MNDLISRKALYQEIARLEELARDRVLDTPTSSPFYDRYSAQLNERTSLKHLVADFPVAQGIDKWIPVSERLPNMEECQKNDCRFIVTDGNRVYEDSFDYMADGYIEPYWTYSTMCQPTAWQPLPPAWKGEEE